MSNTITDTERLDWLEKQTNGLPWTARQSSTGRGFRLHNSPSVLMEQVFTAREAIDQAIRQQQKGKSE